MFWATFSNLESSIGNILEHRYVHGYQRIRGNGFPLILNEHEKSACNFASWTSCPCTRRRLRKLIKSSTRWDFHPFDAWSPFTPILSGRYTLPNTKYTSRNIKTLTQWTQTHCQILSKYCPYAALFSLNVHLKKHLFRINTPKYLIHLTKKEILNTKHRIGTTLRLRDQHTRPFKEAKGFPDLQRAVAKGRLSNKMVKVQVVRNHISNTQTCKSWLLLPAMKCIIISNLVLFLVKLEQNV